MLCLAQRALRRDRSRVKRGNPGLAPSLRSSGGSRAANADGAPRKHGLSIAAGGENRKAPGIPAVILRGSPKRLAPQDDAIVPSFGKAPGAAASRSRAAALS